MGTIIVNQTDDKQVIILNNTPEKVSGVFIDPEGNEHSIGIDETEVNSLLTHDSLIEDFKFQTISGNTIYTSNIYAKNAEITGTVNQTAANSTFAGTGVLSLPTVTTFGASNFGGSAATLSVLYAPNANSYGSNFMVATSKPNLKKVVLKGGNPFVSSSSLKVSPQLKALVFTGDSVATLGNVSAFEGSGIYTNADGYIYVPASQIAAYKADSAWSAYEAKFRTIEDYPLINAPTEWLPE